jgi:hypothetical protein
MNAFSQVALVDQGEVRILHPSSLILHRSSFLLDLLPHAERPNDGKRPTWRVHRSSLIVHRSLFGGG